MMELDRYLEKGLIMSHFMEALLSNDLLGVVMYADESLMKELSDYVKHIYCRVPRDAWGSRDIMKEYRRTRR